jgi:hypothetical protein
VLPTFREVFQGRSEYSRIPYSDYEDGGNMYLRNVGKNSHIYSVSVLLVSEDKITESGRRKVRERDTGK